MCVPAIALLAWFTFWVAALQITIRYIPSWAVFGTGVNQSNPSHLLNYVLIFSEPLSTAGYHPILYTFSCKNEPFLPFKSIFYGAPCNSFASLIATSKPARKAPPPPSRSFQPFLRGVLAWSSPPPTLTLFHRTPRRAREPSRIGSGSAPVRLSSNAMHLHFSLPFLSIQLSTCMSTRSRLPSPVHVHVFITICRGAKWSIHTNRRSIFWISEYFNSLTFTAWYTHYLLISISISNTYFEVILNTLGCL